jgi:hypothetical protein
VTLNGTAQCEYCADLARVQSLQPWGPRLLRYAARLLAFSHREAGRIHGRAVLAEARAWRGPSFRP